MKKLALSLVLTLGVSGMALANNGSINNQSIHTESIITDYTIHQDDDKMMCYVTIIVRNASGMIVNQWTEPYLVEDWGFAECDEIGRRRVAELQEQLNNMG